MNKLHKSILIIALLMDFVSVNAQTTGILKINAVGNFSGINIVNDDDYYEFVDPGTSFCEEVPEGTYYVEMRGYCDDGFMGECIYDVVVSSETDTTILNIDINDAKNFLYVNGKDENGIDFADLQIDSSMYNIDNNIVIGDGVFSITIPTHIKTYSPKSAYKFNDLKDYCKLFTNVTFTTSEQKLYVVNYPTIIGMTDNVTIENDLSSFVKHDEYFKINNLDDLSYYGYCYMICNKDGRRKVDFFNRNCVFDDSKPYTIVMNAVDDDSPLSYNQQKIRIYPTIYNSYDLYSNSFPKFNNIMTQYSIGLDIDGKFFYEPYGNFYSSSYEVASYPDFLAQTPARQYLDEETHFGNRTPLLYQTSNNQMKFVRSPIGYLGENGLHRLCDNWQPIVVKLNGNEVWNDSLFKYNFYGLELDYYDVEMSITNNNIKNDSVEKTNKTTIKFDLEKNDNMPPTFTMLQVLNQEGKESIIINNLDGAEINVAAGDWNLYRDWETWLDIPEYVEGSKVELYYKTAKNEKFLPLEFTEVEEMFHVNYGKYFNVKLSQLKGVNNEWVSMKLVITDAAGNSQEQILENLFYVSIGFSVNEINANSLIHSVYPNPFWGNVTINAAEPVNGMATFTVYNTIGEMVYNSTMDCNETTKFNWNADDNANGVYLYQISTDKGIIQGRVVKKN